MDYLAFTRMRTRFLGEFFERASNPFHEIRRKIEAYEEPYEAPCGYEDTEPPFLSEFQEAGDALNVLGQSVASLLVQALKLYIEHWINELRNRAGDAQLAKVGVGLHIDATYKAAFKQGWFNGYRAYCAALGVDWTAFPGDLGILEQLVLARNAVQHSNDITSVRVRQSEADAERYPAGFFADEFDLALNESMTPASSFLRPPRLDLSGDRLNRVFVEVDTFCAWLDEQHPFRPPAQAR